MWQPSKRSDCCPSETIPCNIECFKKDICNELKDLKCRHKNAFVKRKRLHYLALPKHRIMQYVPKCPCRFEKLGNIINLEQPIYTRTNQLAYPSVRKMLLFKEAYKKKMPYRTEIMNRLIRYSLFSIYSRLQNVQPPEPRVPIHKWDKAEWKKHTRYLKKLAKHKEAIKVKGPPNPKMPYKKMKRYRKLARPKEREVPEKKLWVFTPKMKAYKATERTLKLSKAPVRDTEALFRPLPTPVSPNAKKAIASARTKLLATAPEKRLGLSELKENPFAVAPNAKKAKASPRVAELAEPKEYENKNIRENPQLISPAALKATAKPRTIELAKPKNPREKISKKGGQ